MPKTKEEKKERIRFDNLQLIHGTAGAIRDLSLTNDPTGNLSTDSKERLERLMSVMSRAFNSYKEAAK